MSNSMTVVCLVKSKDSEKNYVNGTAEYRPSEDLKYNTTFDFRLFDSGDNKNIHAFKEGDVVMFCGKFTYRKDCSDGNPMFLSVNQVITWPSSVKKPWKVEKIPISKPYITASVYLNKSPLGRLKNRDIIKCQCNNVFCSFNKSKYDHDFYLLYDNDMGRWTKITQSIDQGNISRVYISGFYKGCYSVNDNVYHGIKLVEFDFESKYSKNADDDDDDLFFTSASTSAHKKHNLSDSSKSTSPDTSQDEKKKKKSTKKAKVNLETDQSVKFKQELSYEEFPAVRAISKLDKSEDYRRAKEKNVSPAQYPYFDYNRPPPFDHNRPPPPPPSQHPYYYSPYYYPPPYRDSFEGSQQMESDKTDKKMVQFDLPADETDENNNDDNEVESKRGTRGKRGRKPKAKGGNPVRKSPRKKGILNIAVDKVVEGESERSDSFMDTESDYQTQNEDDDVSN